MIRFMFVLLVILLQLPSDSEAEVVCGRVVVKNGKPALSISRRSSGSCPRGFTQIVDTSVLIGPQGPAGVQGSIGATGAPGPTGTDGSLRIYGDGSDGDLTISANGPLTSSSGSFQFENLTIQAGVSVTVSSGVVVRCRGNFTNNGTITVGTGATGGGIGCNGSCNGTQGSVPSGNYPNPGIALSNPQFGEIGNSTTSRGGGAGGAGIAATAARQLLRPGIFGGGGGLSPSAISIGLSGAGSLVVLAKGNITNSSGAVIRSNAGNPGLIGTGGAGGGVIVVAAAAQLANSGSIEAKGGSGQIASGANGSAGGGGGGVIHLISPQINNPGILDASGGAGRASLPAGTITAAFRIGGIGGSGSGGSGGSGGTILADGSVSASGAGSTGHALETLADPTSLF